MLKSVILDAVVLKPFVVRLMNPINLAALPITWSTCGMKLREESRIIPKSRTCSTLPTASPFIKYWEAKGTSFFENLMNWHLDTFSSIQFSEHHAATLSRSDCSASTSDCPLIVVKIFMSSAYREQLLWRTQVTISLTKRTKRTGPSREPCGTPDEATYAFDSYPCSTTD